MPFDLALLRRRRAVGNFPTASFNFLSGTLDPRITFSRGTNATLIDSTGRLTYAPNNLLQRSQEFDDAYWVKNFSGSAITPVVTANAGIAPDGTTTAERIQFNCVDNTNVNNRSFVTPTLSFSTGVRYVASVWVKAFDLANVGRTLRLAVDGVSNAVFTLTADWQRITVNGLAVTTVVNFLMETRGTFTTQTADVLLWGAQLEAVTYQTTPSTYVATTASAYYGPRFDYDPVTLAPRGLLIEEARTNLLTYSEAISTGYVPVRATLVNNATAAPSGVVNATKLVEDTTASSTHIVGGTITSGATASFSVFAKAAERTWLYVVSGTATAYFDLSTGAVGTTANCTGSTVNMGNGWYRCIISNFTTSTSVYVGPATGNGGASYTGNGTSGLYLWGLQLEAGSFATSYIPTVASTVTRNADVATMTGTNFSSWFNQTEGTFVADVLDNAAGVNVLVASDGTTTNQLIMTSSTLNIFSVFTGGAFQAMLGVTPPAPYKSTGAYKVNDFAAAANGGTVSTDTSGTLATYSRLSIGANAVSNAAFLNGHIRTIAYFNTRLPNAQLQTLTAPSLATTLSLDFTSGSYNVGF